MKDFWPHKFPLILGWDLSGMVEEVGRGGSRFKIGDEVYSIPDPTRNGAYADYIVVREPELALKPNSLHHIRAAAVPLAALTAWQSLFDTAQLQPGQRVLIHAGSGGVGHFAVQLAKWKGAYVFATASTKNQDLLRELGVDEPIDYTQQRFEDVARNIDIVLDTIGGETQERSWSVLKKDGVLVSLVQPPSEEKAKELGVRAAFVAGHPSGEQLAEIAKIIDSGQLAPVIDRILPLSKCGARTSLVNLVTPTAKLSCESATEMERWKGNSHDDEAIIWALNLALFGINGGSAKIRRSTTA